MQMMIGRPFEGRTLQRLRRFLASLGLDYDDGVEMSCCACDADGEIVATASRQGPVLKCVGVSPFHEGEGLAASVVTEAVTDAMNAGLTHLFLFTKPSNRRIFADLGFFTVAETADMLLMENRRDGIGRFVKSLEAPVTRGVIGAVVANCNPFTRGHQALMALAASECDFLHVFVLSAEKSLFPAALRLEMAKRGTAHIKNCAVHPTGDYLISAATFPDYFLKDKTVAEDVKCQLDLTVFAQCFAAPLGIVRRYVGTEPYSAVTRKYNEAMKAFLPPLGIEVREISRVESGGKPVSATEVRRLLQTVGLGAPELKALLPPTTLELLRENWPVRSLAEGSVGRAL
ncbi:MAG: [citrate (pro-3S)-lyase] ligase [Pyramidobacter sp.]|jgi:[citrate (pro-3S)-lyase] ligase